MLVVFANMSDGEATCSDHAVRTDAERVPRVPSESRRAARRRHSHDSSLESLCDEFSDREVKRRRLGESNSDIQNLMDKMNILTNVLLQNVVLPSQPISNENNIENTASPTAFSASEGTRSTTLPATMGPAPEPVPGPSGLTTSDFQLQRPEMSSGGEPRLLSLGLVNTFLKDPKVPPAHPEHLKRLEFLQKFGDPSWKDVRYTDSLKIHCASPGFTDLEVNDELRQFLKGKDFTANSEKIMAAICNGLITQRELLTETLQQFINWTASSKSLLSVDSIFDKITELFQPTSKFHKTSEEIMQIVCGKRAEYIENRRERILNELSNKNLREGLRKIPPSSRHLFDDGQLRNYIQNTGGMDKWVRPWFYAGKETSKPGVSRKQNQQGSSRESANPPFRPRVGEGRQNKKFSGQAKQPDQKSGKKVYNKSSHLNKKHYDK